MEYQTKGINVLNSFFVQILIVVIMNDYLLRKSIFFPFLNVTHFREI